MTNEQHQEPVVLELAPPPRDRVGPFFPLGLDKDANKEQAEANWARRVIWARKGLLRVPLEDINWAREYLNDRDRRPRADAASLNVDTADGVLRRLQKRYGDSGGSQGGGRPKWRPLDMEKALSDYTPAVEVPSPEEVRSAIPTPEVPAEVPAVRGLLEQLVQEPLDPWALPEG